MFSGLFADDEKPPMTCQETLAIFEALGDKRSRAITLGQIARLLADKGEVDQAPKLHQEKLAI
jgi:hypothetical protein